jgi:BirA family transcriptional regulator, biotin operon repressor / biotin---[acetyl-CoA-carboxylase] ligase
VIIANKIYRKKECDNSMNWAKENIDSVPDGSVFMAENHLHAHGRQDRIWKIYPGQIPATILLKPVAQNFGIANDLPLRLNQLNMALCLGVFDILKKHGVVIKWPNDFMLDGKKVGGILMEAVWIRDVLKGIVFAFAINVNNKFDPSDDLFEIATSLYDAAGRIFDESVMLAEFFKSLDVWYKKWLDQKFEEISEAWIKNQEYLNKQTSVHKKDGQVISGVATNVLDNGDLVIQTDQDETVTIPFYIVEEVK